MLRRTDARARRSKHVQFSPEPLEERKLLTIDFKQGFYAIGDTGGVAIITLTRSDSTTGTANQNTETAQLTVGGGGGTAQPGVDYEPVDTTVTFGPGQTSATVAIPVLSDPGTGTKTLHLSLAQSTDVPRGAAAYLSIMHGPDFTPPSVKSTNLLMNHGRITGFQITFSKPMDVAEATNINNYVVANPQIIHHLRGKKITNGNGIPLASATYDSSTNTVTLVPKGRVRRAAYYEIESTQLAQAINAMNTGSTNIDSLSLMSPITDTSGNALDGNSDGIPDGQLLVFAVAGRAGQKWNSALASTQAANTLLNGG